ncbi:Uracil-DNA glycosylase [Aliiroseovarius halocynthiae]|uniref:Uracil-DNA glycosylase family protein n=1 Tax=Aliiroseovarius halocynthiae TaxID=985055 RepID=A0A545SM36_9RHOB|nr:uracil-DNA glycosylase family protein [Aliiroseovarius halocynthiae]TQV66040.1 uracil-DNA glycosylase family protein [Aliiroseovarius halocynthiae]SMR83252.1 Uracil-DNA glycosylase [Aliiroseovarius halocynthiae]
MTTLHDAISACTLCAERFSQTETAHAPRPVIWFQPGTRIRIIGQAPGMRVYKSGVPFDDPSGDRLRQWMGVSRDTFYDRKRISITPMAFCFPGYDAKGADLPPPKLCAQTWANQVDQALNGMPLTLLVGGYAQSRHLGRGSGVTATVTDWRAHAPQCFPLPHPSWRNTGWLKKNPWFEAELLPELQTQVTRALTT